MTFKNFCLWLVSLIAFAGIWFYLGYNLGYHEQANQNRDCSKITDRMGDLINAQQQLIRKQRQVIKELESEQIQFVQ